MKEKIKMRKEKQKRKKKEKREFIKDSNPSISFKNMLYTFFFLHINFLEL